MHLLFVTFGNNEQNHAQAYFCICSFLAQQANVYSINVVTDQPSWYKSIEKHLNIIEVDQQILEKWKGPFQYMWRIKIKAIEKIILAYPGEPVLYLDTDTFLYSDFNALQKAAEQGFAMMHENEGRLKLRQEKSLRMMTKAFTRQTFEGYRNLQEYDMWNAGIIMIPNNKEGAEIRKILSLCDEMCEKKVRPYFIEQFCFSVVLKDVYGLKAASPCIAHYWSNRIGWNKRIDRFLLEVLLKNYDENEIFRVFEKIDLGSVPVKKIVKNTNSRLKSLIDRIYPPKEVSYLFAQSKGT